MKKFVVVLCVVAMILSQVVVSFAWDEDEPNDTIDTATKISFNDYQDIYESCHGIVSNADKQDWYEFTSKVTGGSRFHLIPEDASMDYDLFLYDDSGNEIASSTSGGAGKGEHIKDIYIRKDRKYYLKVQYISGGYPNEPYLLLFKIVQ